MNSSSRQLLILLSFIAIYFIWGTTYMAIAIGVKEIPPFFMAFLRFSSAGVLMIGYVLFKREPLPSVKSLVNNAIVGTVVLVGGQGLLIWSEQYIPSGYASILIATLPFWFVVMDKRHWSIYFNNLWIILGLLLGFGGILFLFGDSVALTDTLGDSKYFWLASLATLTGGLCWVAGTIYYRSHPSAGSMYANLGWQLILGSLVCLLISMLAGELPEVHWQHVSWQAWLSVLYLSIAGSIIAFVAYTWVLNEVPSAIVSTYAYINPIIAVLVGWLFIDEVITSNQLLGMSVILIGAILVNLNKSKK